MTTPDSASPVDQQRWYLLVHQLPPRPLYLRARIRHRLARAGAVPLKKSVYAMPETARSREDLEDIAREAIAGGGEAYLCAAEFPDGAVDEVLMERSREERDRDYGRLAEILESPARADGADLQDVRRRFEEVARIDFFGGSRRKPLEMRLERMESRRRHRSPSGPAGAPRLAGKVWVTRRGIQVDRIASAWLIRRFVDARARFRFGGGQETRRAGEVTFDMVGGDYAHEGDRCTFETLVLRLEIDDPGVREIAEIVHDVDLKDGKFGRTEAAGVQRVLTGLLLANPADADRLKRGLELFDELHRTFLPSGMAAPGPR